MILPSSSFFVIIFLEIDWVQLGGSHLWYLLQSDSDLSWSYLEGFLTQVSFCLLMFSVS